MYIDPVHQNGRQWWSNPLGYNEYWIKVSYNSVTIYTEDLSILFPVGCVDLAIKALESANMDCSNATPRLRRNPDLSHSLLLETGSGTLVCSLCEVGTSINTDPGQMLEYLGARFEESLEHLSSVGAKTEKAIAAGKLQELENVLAKEFSGLYLETWT